MYINALNSGITLFGDSYIEHLDSHIDQFNTNTLTVSDIGYLLIKYKFILVYFYFNCSHGNLFDNFFQRLMIGLVAKKSLLVFANNKGADQPAHSHSLISAFVIRL